MENLLNHTPHSPEAGAAPSFCHASISTLLFLHLLVKTPAPSRLRLLALPSSTLPFTIIYSLYIQTLASTSFVTLTSILMPNILASGFLIFFTSSPLLLHSQLWLCVFITTFWNFVTQKSSTFRIKNLNISQLLFFQVDHSVIFVKPAL